MFAGLPSLSHDQQQKAVERIQELMSGDEQRTGNFPSRKNFAPPIPASGSWRALRMKMKNNRLTLPR